MFEYLNFNLKRMQENFVSHDIVLSILYWFKSKDHIQLMVKNLAQAVDETLLGQLEVMI